MVTLDPLSLPECLVYNVSDPDELGEDSRISKRFPSYNNYNTYRLRNGRSRHERTTGLLSRFAIKRMRALTLGSIESRFATDVGIDGEGIQRLFLTFSRSGSIALRTRDGGEAISHGTAGLVYHGLPGTQLSTTDGSSRVTLQIEEARLLRTMASLFDDFSPECPRFEPMVDWANPSTAPIARMVQRLIDEIGDPDGLCSVAPAFESYIDALVHLILAKLPHSQSERLNAPCSPAIPRHLRRAEDFMVSHAGQPIAIADIATAAGCGARALQMAFRQFRDTTPLAALQEVRLKAVRAALTTTDAPAAAVAREFGFSNTSRFRAAFLRRFGELPRRTV